MRVLLSLIAALVCAPLAFAQTPSLPTCEAAAHRALDFWLGEWDAFRADNNAPAGRSSIRSEDGGCVITEHWKSLNAPYSGRSLNFFDRNSGRWEQYWVDSTGGRTHFIGGPIENGLQMTSGPTIPAAGGAPVHSRVTFLARPDGTVLQRGETSADGQTWALSYAFIYRRRAD
ncbi:hypothetical protein [Terricaulis sp.]|uniref:hypothetical protein n=1 Tax=Terricaulis sp. TaxID=2768686 RepID=UPI002AC6BA4C|nr:hypothetical protein [Terricaulis sp.]MDZ4691923.1 hypothetical protein [Terricaulis sp.]